ncbi:MAG: hypothetical protein GY815_07145, partial [Gammaproteobacteria bacterium]|nr:hypothetical protein [Gammaproteobacteria bacterium]
MIDGSRDSYSFACKSLEIRVNIRSNQLASVIVIGRFKYGLGIVYSKAGRLVLLKQEMISRKSSWTTVMYTTGFVAHYRRKTKGTEGLFSTPPFPFFLFYNLNRYFYCLRCHTISHRVARFLERQGVLERDAENSYLQLEGLDEDPMQQLIGCSVSYRIAVGPQQGRKVFTLQTLPSVEPDDRY